MNIKACYLLLRGFKSRSLQSLWLLCVLYLVLFKGELQAQNHWLAGDKTTHYWYEAIKLSQDPTFHSALYPTSKLLLSDYNSLRNTHFQDKSCFLGLQNKGVTNYISPILQAGVNVSGSSIPQQYPFKIGLKSEFQIKKKWYFVLWAYAPSNHFKESENEDLKQTAVKQNKMWLPYNSDIRTNEQIGGFLSYQAASFLNLQLGKGKHFWGDGYRSLLLSDFGASYPYASINVNLKRLNYKVLYLFLRDYNSEEPQAGFQKKYAVSHFLSWNIASRLNLNLFETVVWKGKTQNGKNRGFDINYIHPFIFFRPVEFSIGSPDNVIMGAGGRLRIFQNTHLYAQMVLDEFKLKEMMSDQNWWANKYGFLFGVKVYDFLNIKNLFVLMEYNTVRPFTYSHSSSMENYGHLKQPLAHPLGANFKEANLVVDYQWKRWDFYLRMSYSLKGLDKDSINQGGNIYRSYNDNKQGEYGHITTQGERDKHLETELKVSYVLNRHRHFRLESGCRIGQPVYTDKRRYVNVFFVGFNTLF